MKIVSILALVVAENAKIMEDFTKLGMHYVKCPCVVHILKVVVGTVLLMEEEKDASMPVAQNLLKKWVSVLLMEEEQNATMPVVEKKLEKMVTVLNMEES